MLKKLILTTILILSLLGMSNLASASTWSATHCVGCAEPYMHPYTNGDYGLYSYGTSGWDYYRVHYSHPFYKYYSRYPYTQSFYPNPIYRYGPHNAPRILW